MIVFRILMLAAFIQSQGARESANEHLIPEQLFDDPDTPEKEAHGISAVKALQLASEQGQTIYTITQKNYHEVIPKLRLNSTTLSDIRNAINLGHEVTVHERSVRYHGWQGEGYVIIDPQSGAGAYLINGGANGAFIMVIGAILFFAIATVVAITAGIASGPIGWVLLIYNISMLIYGFSKFIDLGKEVSRLSDSDIEAADKRFNEGLFDIISPIFTGLLLGGIVKGAGNIPGDEDLFVLIINDILLSYFYNIG